MPKPVLFTYRYIWTCWVDQLHRVVVRPVRGEPLAEDAECLGRKLLPNFVNRGNETGLVHRRVIHQHPPRHVLAVVLPACASLQRPAKLAQDTCDAVLNWLQGRLQLRGSGRVRLQYAAHEGVKAPVEVGDPGERIKKDISPTW